MDVQFITSVAVITPTPRTPDGCTSTHLGCHSPRKLTGTCTAKTSTVVSASASGPWLRLPRPASEPLTGQLIDQFRR